MENNEIALKFLAHQLMMLADQRLGYRGTPHWLCMSEDSHKRWLNRAAAMVEQWWANELEKARDEIEKEALRCTE